MILIICPVLYILKIFVTVHTLLFHKICCVMNNDYFLQEVKMTGLTNEQVQERIAEGRLMPMKTRTPGHTSRLFWRTHLRFSTF